MFTSALEVAKFEGASIRTVSGVRGQIKRALSSPKAEGRFRATFEDKILMSDIVFLRAWYPVKPRKFYNPVTNLLADGRSEEGKTWDGMRLTGEVRRDVGIKTPMTANSTYKPIDRPTRHFNPLRIPKALQRDLPFKSQLSQMKPRKKKTYMASRAVVLGGEEKRARDLMQKISMLKKEKDAKRREAKEAKRQVYRKKVAENVQMKEAREKRERDEYWAKEGKKRRNSEPGAGHGRGKRSKRNADN
jgi:ribosome biogenesis protein BMS1